MPYQCSACEQPVEVDSGSCPACQSEKSSWTFVPDATRSLVVSRASLTLLRGEEEAPRLAEDARGAAESLVPAEVAYVMPVASARRLLAQGLVPATRHVLTCRVKPASVSSLQLLIDFAQSEPAQGTFTSSQAVRGPGALDYRFLFVHGEDVDVRELRFPDLLVVDLSEANERGFAPDVEVRAGSRGPLELPTEEVDPERAVHVIELEDVSFGLDREIVLPASRVDPEAPPQRRVDGLAVFAAVLRFAAAFPDKQLLIAGHTDTSGSDAHNLKLSEDRARNAYLYLSGQADAWAAHCQAHFERSDFKAILLWAAQTLGWDTDPGPLDDAWGETPRVARDRFRERYNAEHQGSLARHVAQNEADWRAYAELYDQELARQLGVSRPELAQRRAALRFLEPATLACGEAWPREGAGVDGLAEAKNRRVEFLFFDPEETPELSLSPPGAELYAADRRYVPRYLFTLLRVRALDPCNRALPHEPFRLRCGGHTFGGHTDAEGFATALALHVPQRGTFEWGRPQGFDGQGAPSAFAYVRDLYLLPGEDARRRLANLGYAVDLDAEQALRAFQEEYQERFGLAVSGALDPATSSALQHVHDEGDPSPRDEHAGG